MSEVLEKLCPDRDLQCFFFRPSAIAALSEASAGGFSVSGSWRQQFDWAVIEWNRDNVYEHPLYRALPDGDLSGLTLSYKESRSNCIPAESALFPTVDWPYLRIWADDASGDEQIYRVNLFDHATAVTGDFVAAAAVFELSGTLTAGDVVELSWLDEHYYHTITAADTIAAVLADLVANINAFSPMVTASWSGSEITLTNLTAGSEGDRLGIVGTVSGFQTEAWQPAAQQMSGGQSPSQWQFDLDFSALTDVALGAIPSDNVRKMRWTYAAAQQPGDFTRSDFGVVVSDWTVSGAGRAYQTAGLGSLRFEDDSPAAAYSGTWTEESGNYSGGRIHKTNAATSKVTLSYTAQQPHDLYLGTRRLFDGGTIEVSVDSGAAQPFDLYQPGEDYLVRLPLGALAAGAHTVEAELTGQNPASAGNSFYFDFVEAAVPAAGVSAQPARVDTTAATDWDTDHSLALAPERTAWNLHMLGFHGRANHFVGAILFYELLNPDNVFASGTVTFGGAPVFSQNVQVTVDGTVFSRLTLSTDSNESIAISFEYLINNGSTGIWAQAAGAVLTITSRQLGTAGNAMTLSASPTSGSFTATASGSTLSGGADGDWLTDLAAAPRWNRAARDWHRAYFAALDGYGIACTSALSMELSHGDPSSAAGIAQRYPDGAPVLLNTPSLQTNFSPTSADFWKQAYLDMAQLQDEAGVAVDLQFGEVQWWYFPNASGMTFYDDYATTAFQAQYSQAMHVFASNTDSLSGFPEEAEFLPGLIGTFTETIRDFVTATYSAAKFEVLYPHDVNDFELTREVNYPDSDWTPANLDTLKTENFTHTGNGNLNKALESIRLPLTKGFPRNRSAHLIGVFNSREPWPTERRLARAENLESVTLWALDQFAMIGYRLPLRDGRRRGRFSGR